MKIRAIEITELHGRREGPSVASFRHVDRAMPLDVYSKREKRPSLREHKSTDGGVEAVEELYLTILTDEGVEGFYGPIDRSAAFTIKDSLAPMLIGEDPLAGALLWDKMYRSNRHSRTGLFMIGISAIDNALWDLRGKYFNTPVYRLLGGGERPVFDAYVSTIGYSHTLEELQTKAKDLRARGFRRQKWFMGRGPADGMEGLEHNVALVRNLRETLGDDAELMFDASMAWDLNYTLMWADRVREYKPKWIEEPFNPDKTEAWAHLAARAGIAVAGGEHMYTRWEMLRYLESRAISVLQPDPEWCGGVSALVKMCGLGELFDVPVIPHGHGLRASLHVIASQSPATCPMGEFVERTMLRRYFFEEDAPFPKDGEFRLSDLPGFGILIDESKVQSRRSWEL